MKNKNLRMPSPDDRLESYLSIPEVAAMTRYCRRTIMLALAEKKLIGSRNFSATGHRGRWRIKLSEVERWMKGMEVS